MEKGTQIRKYIVRQLSFCSLTNLLSSIKNSISDTYVSLETLDIC